MRARDWRRESMQGRARHELDACENPPFGREPDTIQRQIRQESGCSRQSFRFPNDPPPRFSGFAPMAPARAGLTATRVKLAGEARAMRKLAAELIGTFWLVFGGCGSAVLAAKFPDVGIGLVGVSLAFGLTVLTMAYTIGHISGCHLNPAVTLGLYAGGRFPARDVVPYWAAQVVGAIVAALALL